MQDACCGNEPERKTFQCKWRSPHRVKAEALDFRLTSVYRAEAIVASGVRPWQLMSAFSSATLHRQGLFSKTHILPNLHKFVCSQIPINESVLVARSMGKRAKVSS